MNRYGERNIDLVAGFAENVEIPETFVDYSSTPREYSLLTDDAMAVLENVEVAYYHDYDHQNPADFEHGHGI